ncbi:MAG: VOC family protein [Gammaproteobacteria bacterium]
MGLQRRGISRIGYVWLGLQDPRLTRSRAFYLDQLGMLETFRDPHRSYLRCWHENFNYNLILESGNRNQLIEIGLQVRDQQDLDHFSQSLQKQGHEVSHANAGEPLMGMGESISFTIPGGQRLRLYAEMAQSGYVTGFESPDWVTPREVRGTAAPMFLNHVALTSADPAQTIEFLTDSLGFVISEKIISDLTGQPLSALLFRMSREVGGQELAIFPGEDNHLHHIAFTKEDPNDIMVTGMYLREQGVNIDRYGPTKQPYGNTFSIHFFDDFGIRLELCSGGRLTEAHPEFEAVTWDENQIGKAISYHSPELDPNFLQHSL